MEFINDLESGIPAKIIKATQNIIKNKTIGYSLYLTNALKKSLGKPNAWKLQGVLIRSIGLTHCTDSLPFLKELIQNDYKHTILYRDLAFSIFMLESDIESSLSFLYQSMDKGNLMQICGACSAVLYRKIIPSPAAIEKLIHGISSYTEDEGQIITPRCYIAAVAYLWPKELVRDFLILCQASKWSGLAEVANNSLNGKESKIKIV